MFFLIIKKPKGFQKQHLHFQLQDQKNSYYIQEIDSKVHRMR